MVLIRFAGLIKVICVFRCVERVVVVCFRSAFFKTIKLQLITTIYFYKLFPSAVRSVSGI